MGAALRLDSLGEALRPGALANTVRGSVLLAAGLVTDSEDAIALGRQLAAGPEPSAPSGLRQPSPEEVAEMHAELASWKRELGRAREAPGAAAELLGEMERREAELRDLEERHRRLEEEVRSYPRPQYLGERAPGGADVAVVGNSGVGKSLLINSLRGVGSGEAGWAPVGVNQTTTEPVAYPLQAQPEVRLWDLAGAGVQQFPRGDYTRAIGLRHFDVVLVVTTCRFTQTEAVLLSELASCGVPGLLVRTMVDVDISSNEADHGLSEAETKRGIVEDLQRRGAPRPYLVNARRPGEHDFPRLREDVLRIAREGPGERPEARGAAAKREPRQPQPPRALASFEVGETAEVWSKQLNLWVKCVIEAKRDAAQDYDIVVPSAPEGLRRVPGVPAPFLRKEQAFQAGEDAEIIVLQGPRAGSWVRCRIVGTGEQPETYDVHIPDAPPEARNLPSIHVAALRRAAVTEPGAQAPLLDTDTLKEVLKAFKEVCSTKEFQATIDGLQEIGTHKPEVRSMKKTFVSYQLSPVLRRHQLPTTGAGWAQFLGFTRTQGHDAEVAKLSHEVELLMRVGVGHFFGIQPAPDEQVAAPRDWRQRLKEALTSYFLRTLHKYHQAAQAQAATGAPTSRIQGATANHVNPMSRSMVSAVSASPALRP